MKPGKLTIMLMGKKPPMPKASDSSADDLSKVAGDEDEMSDEELGAELRSAFESDDDAELWRKFKDAVEACMKSYDEGEKDEDEESGDKY